MSSAITKDSVMERIGYILSEAEQKQSIKEIFQTTGLDWTVQQTPVRSDIKAVNDNITNHVINYRSDNNGFLSIVSQSHYHIVNNVEAFNFINDLDGFTIERVGEVGGGKQVFIVGKANDGISIGDNDYIQQYLTFIHGHNGKQGIQLIVSPIRMFCMNQLNIMLRQAQFKYSLKHVKSVEQKLRNVHEALQSNIIYMTSLGETLETLSTTKATITMEQFLSQLIPLEENMSPRTELNRYKMRTAIHDLYHFKDDNQNYVGTKFGMLNAVSDYLSHVSYKNCTGETDANMFLSNIQNNTLLNKAYDILMAA